MMKPVDNLAKKIEWMATQHESRAILIEKALCEIHKIGQETDGK